MAMQDASTLPELVPTRHRFTVEEYLRMSGEGYFRNRVEFINGEIIDMPPQLNDHAFGVSRLEDFLKAAFPSVRFWVRTQCSFRIGNHIPEPDAAVLPYPARGGKTIPTEALLVAEVGDSTLTDDLGEKASLYASGSIQDYWVVDIPNKLLVVHRKPTKDIAAPFGHSYGSIERFGKGQLIAPLASPVTTIDPAALFYIQE